MNLMRTLVGCAVAVLALAVCSPVHGQKTVISLQQAVREGKVEVEVLALGGAVGSTVRVNVRRKVAEELHLQVTPGTVFLSTTGKVQNMTLGAVKGEYNGPNTYRPGAAMVLSDDAKHGYVIESFCLDYHKPAPRSGDSFHLAIHDERASRILQPPQGTQPSPWAFQCALWMDRSGISATELRQKYGRYVTDVDITVARTLLKNAEQKGVASIPAGVAPEVRKELERVFSGDPAVRAQAVEGLSKMGHRAEAAIPFLAANVINGSADHPLPASVVAVHVQAGDVLDGLERLGVPALLPLVRELKARRTGGEQTDDAGEALAGLLTDRLVASLKDGGPRIRLRAATLLGLRKEARAVEPLIAALKDDDPQVRQRAAESLGKITGQGFGSDHDRWQQWWQQNKAGFPPGG